MSATYKTIQWNRAKRGYDLAAASLMALFIAVFVVVASVRHSGTNAISPPILVMRALGACALVNLHVILLVGPLARLSPRCAPLLYNRRHLGVMTFALALLHALVALVYYGGFGIEPAPWALFGGYGLGVHPAQAPFEVLGLLALIVLFLMAATSHDFYLANLSAGLWKWLHMSVYGAYALLVLHVALGSMQSEPGLMTPLLLGLGVGVVGGAHIAAGLRERRRPSLVPDAEGWVDAGPVEGLGEGRCRVVSTTAGERIALVRHEGSLAAMSNVCAHQGGPLGEGRVVGGCLTCPWHGYQYHPHSACAPAPFTEKLALFEVRVESGRVRVNVRAHEPGSALPPCPLPAPFAAPAPAEKPHAE